MTKDVTYCLSYGVKS